MLLLLGVLLHLLRSRAARRWWILGLLPALALPWLTAAARLPPATMDGPALRLVSANLHLHNQDPAELLDWLAQEPADLLLLQELSPQMAAALQRQSPYPYGHLAADDSPFGIGLLSRLPLDAVNVQLDTGLPALEARLHWQGQPIELLVLHPMPPLSAFYQQQRDASLRHWASRLDGKPALIIGDLNCTPWAPVFQQLAASGWRRSGSLAPSWPVAMRGWMGIPIDHVLASPHWQRVSTHSGPAGASDHWPQRVLLRLASPAAAD